MVKKAETCSTVLLASKLTRIAPRARSGGTFMASNTWLGSVLSLEQAEPLATAKPFLSSAITNVSPSMLGKAKKLVLGNLAVW